MKARPLLDERHNVADDAFVEAAVWEVPKPLPGSTHAYKYRLALVIEGRCVLRYDNEAGKGDHRHVGDQEAPYGFSTPGRLFDDFYEDVARWLNENRDA